MSSWLLSERQKKRQRRKPKSGREKLQTETWHANLQLKEIRIFGPAQNVPLQYHAKSRCHFSAGIFCLGLLLLVSQSSPARQAQSNAGRRNAPQENVPQENTPADNPPARVARISYLKGNVSFLRAGVDQWSQAALNFPATTGDRIYTDRGARAELQVGPYTIRLSESTDLTLTNLTDQIMQLGPQQGAIRLSVYQLSSGDTVEIDTANGALTVVEPGKFRIQTDPDGDHTFVNVDSGRLQITAQDFSQTIEGPQAVQLSGQDPI